ncbi:MAG: YCF48-related protein, partial [Bacteroidales bacterium]|nr:YCF48-related protein [Bacteroidales bacterium]
IEFERHYFVIEFANEQTGYVAGSNWFSDYPVLKRTDDGGISWQELPIPEGVESIMGMSLLGADNIWITAENNIFNPELPGYVATAYHSTDGGQTWTLHHMSDEYSPGVSKIKFIDENNGYAIAYSDLFITNDGGQSWEESIIPGTSSYSLTDISITENQSIYISSSKPGLWKSTDGGNNWENKFVGEIGNLTDIMFVDDNLGYLCGYDNLNNYVFKTEDGGQIWQESYSEQRTNASPIIRLVITDLGHIIAATLNRRIIKSTDQGANWEVFDAATDVSINSLTVPSEEVIFAGTPEGTIFKSTNGAESWSEINFPIIPGYFFTKDLHFIDDLNGLGAMNKLSNQGKLFSTSDGGQTWVELYYGYTNRIQGISFYNPSVGIINVEDIGLLKTVDGGQSWSTIYENPAITYVKAFDEQTFLAANSNRLVVVTNNGGDTWHTAFESGPTFDQVNSLFFLNPGKGWLTGFNSLIQVYDDPLMSVEEKLPLPTAQSPYIYPNPATDQITLNCNNCKSIRFYALNGSLVKEIHNPRSNHIQGLNLKAGIYIIEMISAESIFRQRLVIKPN